MVESPRGKGLLSRFPALARLGETTQSIPFVQQLAATECGLACLAMVLGYHGKHVTREQMRDVLSAGRDGTTARDILNAARYYGLRGRGLRLPLSALQSLPRASILHWEFDHFVVFDRLLKDGVQIIDPAQGRRHIPMSEFGRCFTGIALSLEPGETFVPTEGPAPKSDVTSVLWRSGKWGRILTTSAFLQLLALALPMLTGALVDRVVPRSDWHLLLVLSVGLSGVVLFTFLASFVRSHLLLEMRTMFDATLTVSFVEHLVGLPYAFFQRRSAGDLLMRLNSNVVVRQILTSGVLSGVLDGSLMLGYFVLLVVVSPSMAGLVLVFGALQGAVLVGTGRARRDLNAAMLAKHARAQGFQVEMLAGIETLKSMGAEARATEQWSHLFVDELNVSLKEGKLAAIVDATNATLRVAAPLVILCFGAAQVLRSTFSLGTMLALNAFAIGVFAPLSNLFSTAVQLQVLGSYLERIEDVRQTPLEQDASKVAVAGQIQGAITIEHVSFRYGPIEPLVVEDVSITIEPGQLIAIVGRSGSGKSTLASLIVGMGKPSSGRVLYDGTNLLELEFRSVRRQIGVVTQRSYLFQGSVRSNISMAEPDITFDAIVEAAKLAQIHEEIVAMPMGYDTLLADGGASISGGQRQRIALARALLNKPAILLLDEATSALDAVTERKVQQELQALHSTRIVIAHRLSTVRRADRILVMEAGRLVEQGTHEELIGRGGSYSKLVASQME